MDIKDEIEKMRTERGKLKRDAVLIVLITLSVIAVLIFWNSGITGLATLQTFETGFFVNGQSSDELSFEFVPNFVAKVGDTIEFDVKPNRNDVIFTDDTVLFDITQEGKVEFVPSEDDVGIHNAWIIIKNNEGEYYYQNVRILVER